MLIIKNANELTERVKFKKTKRVRDEGGWMVDSEEAVFECWANACSQVPKDVLTSVGTILERTLTFTVRYDQDYEPASDMKIAWKNKGYKIISVNEGMVFKDYIVVIVKQIS